MKSPIPLGEYSQIMNTSGALIQKNSSKITYFKNQLTFPQNNQFQFPRKSSKSHAFPQRKPHGLFYLILPPSHLSDCMCFRAWSASTSILFPHLERIVCVLVAIWLNSPFVIGNPFAWSFLAIRYGVSKNKDPRDPCVVRCLQCFQDLGDPILWINRYPVKTNSSDTVCTSIIGWDSWSSTLVAELCFVQGSRPLGECATRSHLRFWLGYDLVWS